MPDTANDPASLENLHDIISPQPVPWWPPAPGWYILGCLILVGAIWLVIHAARKWRRDAYRREALEELAKIRQLSREPDGRPSAIAQLDVLLKRVALAAWPREIVADLSGQRWLAFLKRTGRGAAFNHASAQVFLGVVYRRNHSQQLSTDQVQELFANSGEWIRHHDPSVAIVNEAQEGE